jgi:hypothetical protein
MLHIKRHVLAATLFVVLVQVSTAAPLAYARPESGAPSSLAPGGAERWLAAALSWLDRLLAGSPPPPMPPGGNGGGVGPLTGSCIDPQGNKPCA